MYKYVLNQVSFDRLLFQKELGKAVKLLGEDETRELKRWCMNRFEQFSGITNEIFANHPDKLVQ